MVTTETLLEQTLTVRQAIQKVLKSIPPEQADIIPPTWKNNVRWHAGHLIVTPRLLTYGILRQPLGVPEDYRKWFAKGTSPEAWGSDAVPALADLADDIVSDPGKLFDSLKGQLEEPFLEPYATSVGTVLRTPAEALNFSMMHDGIHLGMLMALRRALATVQG